MRVRRQGDTPSPTLTLALIALPGWVLLSGGALSMWLDGKSSLSAIPFGFGAITAVALLRLGDSVIADAWPKNKGRIPWFSEVAARMRLSGASIRTWTKTAGLPRLPVLTLTWGPWWVMVAFWGSLWLNAVMQFAALGVA